MDKQINEEFARKFRTLMGDRNLKLKDRARLSGKALSTVSTWRRGRIPRDRNTAAKIAEIFGAPMEYLYEGTKHISVFENEKLEISNPECVKYTLPDVKFPESLKNECITNNKTSSFINTSDDIFKRRIAAHIQNLVEKAQKIDGGLSHLYVELQIRLPSSTYDKL